MRKNSITVTITDLDILWRDAVKIHGSDAAHEMSTWVVHQVLTELEKKLAENNFILSQSLVPTEENMNRIFADEFFQRTFRRFKSFFTVHQSQQKLLEAPRGESAETTTMALVPIKKKNSIMNTLRSMLHWT